MFLCEKKSNSKGNMKGKSFILHETVIREFNMNLQY